MARYILIDEYLVALRDRLAWRHDADDIVAEAEDHLRSAVAVADSTHGDLLAVQRRVLERFGDPAVLAHAFASTPEGGIAMPTEFTRRAGTAALAAGTLWLVFTATWWLTAWFGASWQIWYAASTLALLAAMVLTVGVAVGLHQRHGRLGVVGMVGIVLLGVAAVTSVITWAFTIWGSLVIVGTAIVGTSVLTRDIAPRLPTVAFGGGLAAGGLLWTVLRVQRVGTPDMWGDYVLANGAGLTMGTVLVAAGLFGLGRWLRSEEPAHLDLDRPDAPAAA